MQKHFYVALAAAAIAAQAIPRPAMAVPITYDLIGATATFGTSGTETLTGSFTFDPSAFPLSGLSSVNINLGGPIVTESFTVPVASGSSTIFSANGSSSDLMIDGFQNNLGTSSDPLFSVRINAVSLGSSFASTSLTGSAVPQTVTPIPPAVALFGTALGLLGLILYGRKRTLATSFG